MIPPPWMIHLIIFSTIRPIHLHNHFLELMNEFIFIFVALVLPVPSPDVNEMKENTLVVYDRVSDLFVVEYRKIILKNFKQRKICNFCEIQNQVNVCLRI